MFYYRTLEILFQIKRHRERYNYSRLRKPQIKLKKHRRETLASPTAISSRASKRIIAEGAHRFEKKEGLLLVFKFM